MRPSTTRRPKTARCRPRAAARLANGFFGLNASFPEPLAPGTYTIRFDGLAADGSGTVVESTFDVE